MADTEAVPKLGASSVGVTDTRLPVVASVLPEWAAARTVTPSVDGALKLPLKARVRVAVVVPDAPPETLLTDRPGMAGVVTSTKLPVETPLEKVRPASPTETVAVFKFVSVRVAGLVAEM